jgi:Tfp pilus assembly protein PilF
MQDFFQRDGQIQQSELFSRGARTLDVHAAPFLLNLTGGAYAQANQWDAAERKFRRALRVNAAFSPAHLNLAVCLMRAGNKAGAATELQLAEVYNVGNVFGLATAIAALRREWQLDLPSGQEVPLVAAAYVSLEPTTPPDERLESLLSAMSKYATHEEERAKIRNNLAVHFADSGRPQLALEHFRGALAALKSAGPDRFALARRVFSHMQSLCRKSGFPEANEYALMQDQVAP